MTKYQIGLGFDGDRVCYLYPTEFTDAGEAMAVAASRFGAVTKGWELGGNPPHFPIHYWPDGHWSNDHAGFNLYIFVLTDTTVTVDANNHWVFTDNR